MLRSNPGEFRRPAPKQRENSRTVFRDPCIPGAKEIKAGKGILGRVGGRLAAGRSLLQGLASTPARRGKVCSRLTAKTFLVQREVANEMSRRDCRQKPCLSFISPSAGGVFCKGIVSTARRRGPTFLCARRRGLRSMSGHPAYAWGNPPTLRRSSFPQRASRPAGGPIPKYAWDCAPRPPNA